LSNVPPWLVLLGLIVLVAGGAVLVLMYIRHRFPEPKGDEHNDVIRFAFAVVGFVFAFFTGFVASAMTSACPEAAHHQSSPL
jgi:multisubunit Na+/H+ antiporter MnhB subunit